jgi:FtsP/CotA-like multicopper oxidase with cupredoxin domain
MWTDMTGTSTPVTVNLKNGTRVEVNITENPRIVGGVAPIEEWSMYNFTEDAHPIHLHLVRFQVIGRTLLNGTPSPNVSVQPWEEGYKDTVVAFPSEITTVRAKFDIGGLFVWHCHIVEHEDNEMMRPYVVSEVPAP